MKPTARFHSIDIVRGVVMIIMALDHSRDFFHITAMTANPLDPAATTIPLFFTRWITHFCAPVFVFLSGLSAFISSQHKPVKEATVFLRKRGLWLIIVEIVLVTLGLTFNPFYNFIILQVIWAIGCSMLLLSFLRTSYKAILITGLVLVLGHNLTDWISLPQNGISGNLIKILLTAFGTVIPVDDKHLIGVFYSILPWTGIMFIGYAAGAWYKKDFNPAKRKQYLLISGAALLLLFVILRLINGYGDPAPRRDFGAILPNILSFLNVSKYPPSLQYTCLMLGPALMFLAVSEHLRGRIASMLRTYGRVPFFYYILHFYLLHTLLVIAFFATGHGANEIAAFPMPFYFRPVNFGFSLPVVYLIWIFSVAVLYQPCRWFWKYKQTHSYRWLRYL